MDAPILIAVVIFVALLVVHTILTRIPLLVWISLVVELLWYGFVLNYDLIFPHVSMSMRMTTRFAAANQNRFV